MFCQFRHLRTWLVHHWMTGSLTSRVTIKAAGRTLSTPAYTEGDLLCSALLPPPSPPRRGAIYARLDFARAFAAREFRSAFARNGTYYVYLLARTSPSLGLKRCECEKTEKRETRMPPLSSIPRALDQGGDRLRRRPVNLISFACSARDKEILQNFCKVCGIFWE